MSKKHIFILLTCLVAVVSQAQTVYTLDASRLKPAEIKTDISKWEQAPMRGVKPCL